MATYEYTALAPDGTRSIATVDANSVYEATELVRSMELNLESIGLQTTSTDGRPPRYEPVGERPPPAPREIPSNVTGVVGHWVLVIVGSMFSGIASIFILIGLGLLLSGNVGGLFMVLFPLIHFAVGAGLLYWTFTRRARRRHVYSDGVATMAKVDAVGYNRSVRVNGKNPYEVVWTFELDGRTFHDKRSSFDAAIQDLVPGDRLWVIYDPDDPEDSVEWPPL